MKEIELINKRKPREKHFLNEDGTITAQLFDHDVHFEKNGHYEPINTKIISTGNSFVNSDNTFKTEFDKNIIGLINISKNNYYLKIFPKTENLLSQIVKDNIVNYKDNINDIDYNYEVQASRLKETIIFNCKETAPELLSYYIDTNLSLEIIDNKLKAKNNDEVVFVLETPFMQDASGNKNQNIGYELIKQDDIYILNLIYNLEWVKDKNRPFPIVIDPTILPGDGENVYDTYISTLFPDLVNDDRDRLAVNCSSEVTSRILLKFVLPELSPNEQIVSAHLYVTTHPDFNTVQSYDNVEVHEITTSWDESTATWNNMKDNYNKYIDNYFIPTEYVEDEQTGQKLPATTEVEITRLVKGWYSGKPNNGLMLKLEKETYDDGSKQYIFISKTYDYNNATALRPYITITYKNKTGIDSMGDHTTLSYYHGNSLINNYTGNMTSLITLNKSNSAEKGTFVSVVHGNFLTENNTLKTIANGWKLYYYETLEYKTIDDVEYLEYFDSTGGVHYFIKNDDETYTDEEGMNLKIKFENGKFIMYDSSLNNKEFDNINNKYYMTKINSEGNTVDIIYTNERITKIIDSYGSEITIFYNSDSIVIESSSGACTISLNNNYITKIEDKYGSLTFTYDSKGLITSISDSNNASLKIDYYDLSGKVKKVTSYGLNNEEGKNIIFNYNNNVTDIISGNVINSLTFDDLGKLISNVIYKNENKKLYEASGYSLKYSNNPSNISITQISEVNKSIKYVNNLLEENPMYTIEGIETTEEVCVSPKSYKPINSELTIKYRLNLPEKNDSDDRYTFSFAIKTSTKTYVDLIAYKDVSTVMKIGTIEIEPNLEFERYSITGAVTNYFDSIGIVANGETNGDFYITDCQLEKGEVANTYNLVSNSDFSRGLEGWSVSGNTNFGTALSVDDICSIDQINDEEKALTFYSGLDRSMSASKIFKYSGKRGDVYNLSFWYKHKGLANIDYGFNGNSFTMAFISDDPSIPGHGTVNMHLNKTSDEWQFYNASFVAENDYDSFMLSFISQFEVNTLTITNIMLVKSLGSYAFEYDENGNIKRETDVFGNDITYSYNEKNSLINIQLPSNLNYYYERDNENPSRLLSAFTDSGLNIKFKYDDFGNVVKNVISNDTQIDLKDNTFYQIRAKGTKNYLSLDFNNNSLILKENICNNHIFKVIKQDDGYKIIFNEKNLYVNKIEDKYSISLSARNYSIFEIRKSANGSHTISYKDNPIILYFTASGDTLSLEELKENESIQEFYFEKNIDSLYIETYTEYTNDGRYITKATDINGNTSIYDIDEETGNIKSLTDANGNVTKYSYNDKNQLSLTEYNNKHVYQIYNNQNLLSEIYNKNDKYVFEYDNFMKISKAKLNDNIIVNYFYYPNNGNLQKMSYANGSEITYVYDEFERLSTIKINDVEYKHFYDNFGNLVKILSPKDSYEYFYDYNERIKKIKTGDLIIEYDYDLQGNICSTIYFIKGQKYITTVDLDDNHYPVRYYINNSIIENEYDELGRLNSRSINGYIIESKKYVSNGKKTSYYMNSFKTGNDIYYYDYDNNYNIKKIILNDTISNEYEYDSNNQLILEKDYLNNIKISYTYDENGNINERLYTTIDDVFIKKDLFKYDNNNCHDLLTLFNEENYLYDQMGNVISTLDETFEWVNDSKLKRYDNIKNNVAVTFEYNIDGRIISKNVNGIITEYLYDSDAILSEKTDKKNLVFLRDGNRLIGFDFNDVRYYYRFNALNDIIGIYDENLNLIVTYTYDSWGNLINVFDANNKEITFDRNHIAFINPFRYRSYYYDEDINLYVLPERMYNPLIGRFINSDSFLASNILGTNLYLYCENNPVSKYDESGNGWLVNIISGLVVGAIEVGAQMVSNAIIHEPIQKGAIGAFVGGFASGFTFGKSNIATKVISKASPAIPSIVNELTSYNETLASYNGMDYKTANVENITTSVLNVAWDTSLNYGKDALSTR